MRRVRAGVVGSDLLIRVLNGWIIGGKIVAGSSLSQSTIFPFSTSGINFSRFIFIIILKQNHLHKKREYIQIYNHTACPLPCDLKLERGRVAGCSGHDSEHDVTGEREIFCILFVYILTYSCDVMLGLLATVMLALEWAAGAERVSDRQTDKYEQLHANLDERASSDTILNLAIHRI